MDWQQIETAPTDGTAVLVTNGRGVWIAKHKAIFQYGYNPDSPWFCLMLNKDHIPGKFRAGKPTHWMPLPEAPNTPADIEANIASEHYFTADQGADELPH